MYINKNFEINSELLNQINEQGYFVIKNILRKSN